MIRLRTILVVAVGISLLAAPPAMAKIDVVKTALRALRIAERADKEAQEQARQGRVQAHRGRHHQQR